MEQASRWSGASMGVPGDPIYDECVRFAEAIFERRHDEIYDLDSIGIIGTLFAIWAS
jgi:hypothetical protein